MCHIFLPVRFALFLLLAVHLIDATNSTDSAADHVTHLDPSSKSRQLEIMSFTDTYSAFVWFLARFGDWAADKVLSRFFIMILQGLL